jgi:16S rRNA C1402 (ribose-2'-O) methylase RsmI
VLAGREITKKFEEFVSGPPSQLLDNFLNRSPLKGEFALLVGLKKK